MADFTADFEAGSNGNTVTTGAGEASATAWTTVNGTPVYDNTRVAHGGLAVRMDSAGDNMQWDGSSLTDHYGRFYLYATAWPTTTAEVWRCWKTGNAHAARIVFEGDGRISFRAAGDINIIYTTHAADFAVNQWIRVEYHVVHSATVGQLTLRLYNNAGSSTPSEEVSSPATWNTDTEVNEYLFGRNVGDTWTADVSLDDIVANATNWPGPVVGDEHNRFAGPQLLAGTAATIYTAPDSGARIDTIHVSNPSGSPVDFTLSIGADAAGTRLWDGYSIPADSVWERQLYLPLANGEIVQSFASTAGVLVLTLDGKTL